MQHGCSRFLAYVVDTKVEGKKSIETTSLIQDFSELFPEDLLGVPPERRMEF